MASEEPKKRGWRRRRPSTESNAKSIAESDISDPDAIEETPTKPPPWRVLFAFTIPRMVPLLVAGIIVSIAAGATAPAQNLFVGDLFEGFTGFSGGTLSKEEFLKKETKYILYVVAIAAASWVLHSLEFMIWLAFGELQAASARDRLFHGLMAKETEWYDLRKNGIGAQLPRMQAQIRELQLATAQPLGSLFALASTAILSLLQALITSPKLTLVTLASSPVILGLAVWAGRPMYKNIDKMMHKLTEAQKYTTSAFSAIETVKCFNGQEIEAEKYSRTIEQAGIFYAWVAHGSALQMALIVMLSVSMFVQGFYYGGILIAKGEITSGDVVTTFFSAIGAFQAIQAILPQMIVLEKGRSAGATLRAIMAQVESKTKDGAPQDQIAPETCLGNIKVKNLTFAYPSRPDVPAVQDITMHIKGGDMSFLIGKSGSGKSTISQLLMRFYNSPAGTITVDSVPLEQLDTTWLRSNVTLVEQTSLLFSDTIFNNIAFGRKDYQNVTKEEVMGAVQFALLQLMISDMPDGLDTKVGFRGGAMSGGQRQRMALARARLRDTPILILDESTSALDHISRTLVMDALRAWRKGKTTIIITHDITQIMPDDYIYLLGNGRLVQEGYRKQLEKQKNTPFQAFLSDDQKASIHPLEIRDLDLGNRDSWGRYAADMRRARPGVTRTRRPLEDIEEIPLTGPNEALATLEGETSTQRTADNKTLKVIFSTIWPNLDAQGKTYLLCGAWGATVHAVASPVFSYILSKLLATYAVAGGQKTKALIYAMVILGVAFLDATHTYLMRFMLEVAGERWVDSVRTRAYERILDQDREFFSKEENGMAILTESLDRNAEEMRNLLGRFLSLGYVALLMSIVALIWALATQWKVTLIAFAIAPYVFGVTKVYAMVAEKWEGRSNDASDRASAIFTETFINIKTVRALTLETHFLDKYTIATNETLVVGFKRSFFAGFFYGLSDSAGNFAIALIFFAGTKIAVSGAPVTDIITVFTMLIFTITNVSAVLEFIPQIGSSKDTAARLLRLAQLPKNSHEHLGDTRITTVGDIVFDRLRFCYPSRPDQTILKNISLRLKPGTATAIVGSSGSGKSTIANLLLDLYSTASVPNSHIGDLTFGGRDMKHISTPSLRTLIVPVQQTPTVFAATVAQNIAYALPSTHPFASPESISAAAHAAGVDDFILSLPQGYSTFIGEGGLGLSGGQAQRIAIARALVRKPSVLILDEATSALDVETANLIRQTIATLISSSKEHTGGEQATAMTVIIITHHQSMMEIAERVVVLDDGRIVEEGSFEGLMKKKGGGALANLLSGGEWMGEEGEQQQQQDAEAVLVSLVSLHLSQLFESFAESTFTKTLSVFPAQDEILAYIRPRASATLLASSLILG
ncbi:bile salt export pump [Sphaerulina musiva SO2202]|uniref:Bile salt export pump n=1 Tax=Sphaerulina musiva (strain SO2202) TaxID=692275 RepID=N1QGJ7_SPHMS|nr:bile salt export pump [Sphaerulina musiva SO2202]EMF16331.1 bile salt export pump [Sphaerulina musiva SO2202]